MFNAGFASTKGSNWTWKRGVVMSKHPPWAKAGLNVWFTDIAARNPKREAVSGTGLSQSSAPIAPSARAAGRVFSTVSLSAAGMVGYSWAFLFCLWRVAQLAGIAGDSQRAHQTSRLPPVSGSSCALSTHSVAVFAALGLQYKQINCQVSAQQIRRISPPLISHSHIGAQREVLAHLHEHVLPSRFIFLFRARSILRV